VLGHGLLGVGADRVVGAWGQLKECTTADTRGWKYGDQGRPCVVEQTEAPSLRKRMEREEGGR
jgi:hypothetical protein